MASTARSGTDTCRRILESLGGLLLPNWRKGALLLFYFLIAGLLATLGLDALFSILTWPSAVFPSSFAFAAILQMAFAYLVAAVLDALLFERGRGKEASSAKRSGVAKKR